MVHLKEIDIQPQGPVWHTRELPRIAAQQYGDKNKLMVK